MPYLRHFSNLISEIDLIFAHFSSIKPVLEVAM